MVFTPFFEVKISILGRIILHAMTIFKFKSDISLKTSEIAYYLYREKLEMLKLNPVGVHWKL